MLFELSCLHSNHMLQDDQHIFMTRTLMRQTGLLNVGPQKVGTYMDRLALFGILAVTILILLRKSVEAVVARTKPGPQPSPTFSKSGCSIWLCS